MFFNKEIRIGVTLKHMTILVMSYSKTSTSKMQVASNAAWLMGESGEHTLKWEGWVLGTRGVEKCGYQMADEAIS